MCSVVNRIIDYRSLSTQRRPLINDQYILYAERSQLKVSQKNLSRKLPKEIKPHEADISDRKNSIDILEKYIDYQNQFSTC